MKLPIKKRFFDKIKKGDKSIELRDAHITFICEETGEKLRKEVIQTRVIEITDINLNLDELEVLKDLHLIEFVLK